MIYNICMIMQLKILYVKMKFNNSGIKKVSRPTSKAGKFAVYAASRLSVYYSNSLRVGYFHVHTFLKNYLKHLYFCPLHVFHTFHIVINLKKISRIDFINLQYILHSSAPLLWHISYC